MRRHVAVLAGLLLASVSCGGDRTPEGGDTPKAEPAPPVAKETVTVVVGPDTIRLLPEKFDSDGGYLVEADSSRGLAWLVRSDGVDLDTIRVTITDEVKEWTMVRTWDLDPTSDHENLALLRVGRTYVGPQTMEFYPRADTTKFTITSTSITGTPGDEGALSGRVAGTLIVGGGQLLSNP